MQCSDGALLSVPWWLGGFSRVITNILISEYPGTRAIGCSRNSIYFARCPPTVDEQLLGPELVLIVGGDPAGVPARVLGVDPDQVQRPAGGQLVRRRAVPQVHVAGEERV